MTSLLIIFGLCASSAAMVCAGWLTWLEHRQTHRVDESAAATWQAVCDLMNSMDAYGREQDPLKSELHNRN